MTVDCQYLVVFLDGSEVARVNMEEGQGPFSIGRGDHNRIDLAGFGNQVSRNHGFFEVVNGLWWFEDAGSRYGSFIAERRIHREAVVDGLSIRLGEVVIRLSLPVQKDALDTMAEEAQSDLRYRLGSTLVQRINLRRLQEDSISETELETRIREAARTIVAGDADCQVFTKNEREELVTRIVSDILRLGPLEPLIADDDITEIMVVGPANVYVEKSGKITLSETRFRDGKHLRTVIERIVTPIGKHVDESSPLVDARLRDGSRVNAVLPPISPETTGPILTIRKFGKDVFTAERLMGYGSLTKNMSDFLALCVKARKNIVVSGGTGSGKTSLLNAISRFIGDDERIVTIEDALELKMQQDHVVSLEARPANAEGKGQVSIRALVKNSLRMRPDRIVVGECRGGEALDMLQAMNTGHDGSLTTVHANSPYDAVSRLETLVLMAGIELPLKAVQHQIYSAVDIFVQTTRLLDGSRKVVSITEIVKDESGRPCLDKEGDVSLRELFRFTQEGIDFDNNGNSKVKGNHVPVGRPSFMTELELRGFNVDSSWFEGVE